MRTHLVLLSVLVTAIGCSHSEESTGHWGYTGENGPFYWAQLTPDYALCGSGLEQSPIDITGSFTNSTLERLAFNYQATGSKLTNNGHTLQVGFDTGSTLTVGGQQYSLAQFHVHVPSEHQVNGVSYAMEVHMVHKNAAGKLAVVGVLLDAGAENPTIGKVLESAPTAVGDVSLPAKVNASDFLPQDPRYYTYAGSLTTPPCTEGVRWIVMKQPGTVSWAQVDRFLHILEMNARPVQPLHERHVENFASL